MVQDQFESRHNYLTRAFTNYHSRSQGSRKRWIKMGSPEGDVLEVIKHKESHEVDENGQLILEPRDE